MQNSGVSAKRIVVSGTSNTAVHVVNPDTRLVYFNVDARTGNVSIRGELRFLRGPHTVRVDVSGVRGPVDLIVPESGRVLLGGNMHPDRPFAQGGFHEPDHVLRYSENAFSRVHDFRSSFSPFLKSGDALFVGFENAAPGSLVFSAEKKDPATLVKMRLGEQRQFIPFTAISTAPGQLRNLGTQPFKETSSLVLVHPHSEGTSGTCNGVRCQSWISLWHVDGSFQNVRISGLRGISSGTLWVPRAPALYVGLSKKRAALPITALPTTAVQAIETRGPTEAVAHVLHIPSDSIRTAFAFPPHADLSAPVLFTVAHKGKIHAELLVDVIGSGHRAPEASAKANMKTLRDVEVPDNEIHLTEVSLDLSDSAKTGAPDMLWVNLVHVSGSFSKIFAISASCHVFS